VKGREEIHVKVIGEQKQTPCRKSSTEEECVISQ